MVAQGQTILLSGSGTTLGVLGAGSPSDESGSGRVYYTDGTTSSFSITLDNYFNAPVSNDVIATLPYVNDTNPATAGNGGKPGQRKQTVYVFYTSAPLTAGKTVQAITLPAGGKIPASGTHQRHAHLRPRHRPAVGAGSTAERQRQLTPPPPAWLSLLPSGYRLAAPGN